MNKLTSLLLAAALFAVGTLNAQVRYLPRDGAGLTAPEKAILFSNLGSTGSGNLVLSTSPTLTTLSVGSGTNNALFNGPGVITTAGKCTIAGVGAGASLTAGWENTIYGENAGSALTGGGDPFLVAALNTLIGASAGANMTTGTNTVAIGQKALVANTTEINNVGIGKSSAANFHCSDSVIIGKAALENVGVNGSGQYIIAIGENAGQYMNPGVGLGNNTYIGFNAGAGFSAAAQNTGTHNVYIGSNVGSTATTVSNSVVIGDDATLNAGTTSVIIGYRAGRGSGAVNRCVLIGDETGQSMTTGDRRNVFIGEKAGIATTTGTGNIFLGKDAGENNTTGNFQFIAGSNSTGIVDIYFGGGISIASPYDYTIHGTGGSGTNIVGGGVIISGGLGTGTAAGGNVVLQTSDPTTSGSTSGTATTRFTASKAANISTVPIRLKGYTVATLPTGTTGDTAYVTDALAPTFLATIVGGGAIVTPVFYNGTNWVGY